jgi:hypothetical protein
MNIGEPKRTFEVEPVTIPVPERVPMPDPERVPAPPDLEPAPRREPAVPSK